MIDLSLVLPSWEVINHELDKCITEHDNQNCEVYEHVSTKKVAYYEYARSLYKSIIQLNHGVYTRNAVIQHLNPHWIPQKLLLLKSYYFQDMHMHTNTGHYAKDKIISKKHEDNRSNQSVWTMYNPYCSKAWPEWDYLNHLLSARFSG